MVKEANAKTDDFEEDEIVVDETEAGDDFGDESDDLESDTDESDEDDFTGIEAQRDPEFMKGDETGNLEAGINELDDFDLNEYVSGYSNYDHFLALPKRELIQFIRAVEPLTKASIDQYGKTIRIECISKDLVELLYVNSPFRLALKVSNKSQKMVTSFCISVSLLKKVIAENFANVVLVEEEGEMKVALCDSLLFLETAPLSAEEYVFARNKPTHPLDIEIGRQVFRRVGTILGSSDRASEKIIVVKDNKCYLNTGMFSAAVSNPFKTTEEFVLYKTSIDLLSVLMEISKVDIRWDIKGETLQVEADGLIYCEIPITPSIDDFFSVKVAKTLDFKADIIVVNDSMIRLLSVVNSFEYLSDIVTISFTKDSMKIKITANTLNRESVYTFPFVEGTVQKEGEMKVSAAVMKPYLEVAGAEVKYAFNEEGICISSELGNFIIRRSN